MHDEVDPTAIIERAWCANKRVFAPVTDTHGTMNFRELTPDTEITRNSFGLWEPVLGSLVTPRSLDVVVTPLVAFDDDNNRIGMGGGYFDRCFRFLRNRRKWLKPKLIGLAFDCQKVTGIVPDSWDVQLHKIFTETKT